MVLGHHNFSLHASQDASTDGPPSGSSAMQAIAATALMRKTTAPFQSQLKEGWGSRQQRHKVENMFSKLKDWRRSTPAKTDARLSR